MNNMLRFPDLALGDLEQDVLERLWDDGPSKPTEVHQQVGLRRGISVNTVSSALKRLYEKGLLEREKVSHSYVYRAAVSRTELQRQLMGQLVEQFGQEDSSAFLVAFVDLAQERGEDTLRRLEQMIADRLSEEDP